MAQPAVNMGDLYSDVRKAIINSKANASPIILRLAWHASGTFDKTNSSGGSDGATMRFEPESTDDANAGLGIVRDMLLPVHKAHPEVSMADLWIVAGCAAIEFMGGPKIPFGLGRADAKDGSACPMNGRLPDAAQGAQHLRDVFYRQGFNDQEIVALSGAHTLGSCHKSRSGFDGPWTRNPLVFDNNYFKLLLGLDWVPREWDGNLQYTDTATKKLMMLPTDMCLIEDPKFKEWVEKYAADQQLFFKDFAKVAGKLFSNGCPAPCLPGYDAPEPSKLDVLSKTFREQCMHGATERCHELKAQGAITNGVDSDSGRTGLHKAAFGGHDHIITWLVQDCKIDVNAQDNTGDTALHDAARFGHKNCVKMLLEAGAKPGIKNKRGQDAVAAALEYEKLDVAGTMRSKL